MDQNPENSQATPKQQVVERVRAAANLLVTVRSNPSVDELAAAIGLTLMLNKLGKHATAVFSGAVPSTLEFLKPEDTLEQNTDSLRDFIVSLDKSKADKLRYKVEENVVKIFITPYRTSISEKDLEFTQGDFNVDVVLALGVTQREELDQAITAHGRILHDATVITVTAGQHESSLGAINWQEAGASSLSEMLVSVSEAFQGGIIDSQMATAFLTGIVAETERFSNPKTSPKVMTMAAQLMAAGANQQLIANELQKVAELTPDQPVEVAHDQPAPEAVAGNDGSLSISHSEPQHTEPIQPEPASEQPEVSPETGFDEPKPAEAVEESKPSTDTGESFLPPLPAAEVEESFEPLMPEAGGDSHEVHTDVQLPEGLTFDSNQEPSSTVDQIHIDDDGNLIQPGRPLQPKHNLVQPLDPSAGQPPVDLSSMLQASNLPGSDVTQAGGTVSPATGTPAFDLPPLPTPGTIPEQPDSLFDAPPPPAAPAPPPAPELPDETTLLDIEKTVHSPHLDMSSEQASEAPAGIDTARNAVQDAISSAGYDANHPEPRTDLNAQPFSVVPPAPQFDPPPSPTMNGFDPSAMQPNPGLQTQTPGGMPLHTLGEVIPEGGTDDNLPPPPPVPPPMMPMQ